MRSKFFLFVLFIAFWVSPVAAAQNNLQLQDIQRVMEKFYALHITNKELSPLLIRRAMKIYIENFDSERSYLLESEVRPYLSLSDKKAQEIVDRVNQRDYSDFVAL